MHVPITPIGDASAATVVWRQRGRLYLTVIVKGTFHIAPDSMMTLTEAEPIATEEQDDGSGMGLYSASDVAPYLRYTDVELTGHAHPPPAVEELEARLEVIRDGTPLFDKSVLLAAPGDARSAGRAPVRLVGMGPLSRTWPIRRALLGGVDPSALEGHVLEIPDVFNWSYYQAAPPDQRIGPLRGDEWIVLTGVHPDRAWLRTRLPGARGVARVFGAEHPLRGGPPMPLAADTLHLDVDLLRCTVLWRGWMPIADIHQLSTIHVVAGIELSGEPLAWIDPFRCDAAESPWAHAPESASAPTRSGSWPPRRSSVPPPEPGSPFHASSRAAYTTTVALDAAEIERHTAAAGGEADPLPSPPPAPPLPRVDAAFAAAHPDAIERTMALDRAGLPR